MYLCQSDIDLLRDIEARTVTSDSHLTDSQSRSARYLYNQFLISAFPFKDSEALKITALGVETLKGGDDVYIMCFPYT